MRLLGSVGTISETLDLWKGDISCLNLDLVFNPVFLRVVLLSG